MFQALFAKRPTTLKDDLLSGLTVALALVPEAIAFALIAKVPLAVGLHAAFIMGFMAAIFGGRPGMISGATGAMAVVLGGLLTAVSQGLGIENYNAADPAMQKLVTQVYLEHVFLAVGLAGLIQICAGILRLGKFIRLVPHPVMLGFVNSLAIVILMAQFPAFYVEDNYAKGLIETPALVTMGIMVAITMAVIVFLPKLTKMVPGPLAGIVVVAVLAIVAEKAFGLPIPYVNLNETILWPMPHIPGYSESLVASAAELNTELWPLWSLKTLQIILPTALVLAAVGLIESLMTMSLIDEITETRGRGNRECIGQGLGNLVSGGFASMGGCAMIGQSMININSGGRSRLSGVSAAVMLLLLVVVGSSLIAYIPKAAVVGVMFMVVIGTFEWASLKLFRRIPYSDILVMLIVIVVTLTSHNLALAVLCGVLTSALVFAWQQAKHIHVHTSEENGSRVYHLHGVVFFASINEFRDCFNVADDPDDVIIDFAQARVADHSAIEAINVLTEKYLKAGKTLHLRHLSPECRRLLDRATKVIEVNVLEDPTYHVADDKLA